MNTRTLGNKGFNVSEVGLGCWQIGANWGNEINKDEAFDILNKAVENGITFFDTADVYGDGRSEELIGEFIKSCKTPIKIATKFGRSSEVFPNNYSEEALRKHIDASLKRLGVKTLDLLQLHCIPLKEL